MNKEYGVFNQKTGVYEKFSEFVLAKTRQQELLDECISETRQTWFGLTLYLYDNRGNATQCSCDEQGEPLLLNNLKMDDLGIKKGKLYLPVYGVFNQKLEYTKNLRHLSWLKLDSKNYWMNGYQFLRHLLCLG